MEEDRDAAAVSCSGSIAVWKKDAFVPGPNALGKRPIELVDLLCTTYGTRCRHGVKLADFRCARRTHASMHAISAAIPAIARSTEVKARNLPPRLASPGHMQQNL